MCAVETPAGEIPAQKLTEEQLRRLLETSRAIPWAADTRTWLFTYVGPQAVELLGYPREQWLEKGFWVKHIHPDDQERAISYCETASRLYTDYEFDYRMIAADGRVVCLHDIVHVVSSDGIPESMQGFMIDITDRKKADQARRESARQIRLIADSIPALVAYVDNEQRYKFNNATYLDWFGISAEEARGRTMREVLGESYHKVRPFAETALSGQACKFEFELPHREKGLRQIEANLLPHRNDDDEVLGFYVLAYDITDRKRADEERRRHQAELAHLSRVATMGEFSAALAHELNQPLAAILANARAAERLLEQGATDSVDLTGALNDIAGAAKRAGDMIGRLRALMRKGEVELQPLEINETIRGIEAFVQAEALRCNVELHLDLAADLPQVQGNPIELQQVILNLVNNGLESMDQADDGDGKLSIRTDRHESGALLVAVEDSGPPPDEGALELMFEPFYSTRDDGLGIGLSLSRSIIKAHGGELWATANPERGLTLQFTVPCEEPSAQ